MLQRFIHTIVYAAIRAYLDAVRDAKLYQEEVPTDVDRARADSFRNAVNRMRKGDQDPGGTRHDDTPPSSEAFYGNDLRPHSQRHDAADGTGGRRVVDSKSIGSGI